MNILRNLLFFILLFSQHAWSQYVDQKHPYFIKNQIIPSIEQSSLCGPVTFINWLIFENKINELQGLSLLKTLNQTKNGGINHGHTQEQLLSFIERTEQLLNDRNLYDLKSYDQIELDDVMNKKAQILLLKFNELPKRSFDRFDNFIPYDGISGEETKKYFLHFVLKIPAKDGTVQIIDPEQPNNQIFLNVKKENHKILFSNEHYQYFGYTGFNGPHEVQIIGAITRKN